MNSSEVLEALRQSEPALRRRGVQHAALFGSLARGSHRADSDIEPVVDNNSGERSAGTLYGGLGERSKLAWGHVLFAELDEINSGLSGVLDSGKDRLRSESVPVCNVAEP